MISALVLKPRMGERLVIPERNAGPLKAPASFLREHLLPSRTVSAYGTRFRSRKKVFRAAAPSTQARRLLFLAAPNAQENTIGAGEGAVKSFAVSAVIILGKGQGGAVSTRGVCRDPGHGAFACSGARRVRRWRGVRGYRVCPSVNVSARGFRTGNG